MFFFSFLTEYYLFNLCPEPFSIERDKLNFFFFLGKLRII
jgi:hypothetical protein